MPKKRRRSKAKKGPFLPDRIVGFCLTLPFLCGAPLVAILAALLVLEPATLSRKDLPKELKSLPPDLIVPLTVGVAVLLVANLWASIRLWQGRRAGLIVSGLLALPSAGYSIYERTLQTAPPASGWSFTFGVAWATLVPLFCLARLLGWGPRPT